MKTLESLKSYKVLTTEELTRIKGGYSSMETDDAACADFACMSNDDCPEICPICWIDFRCAIIAD